MGMPGQICSHGTRIRRRPRPIARMLIIVTESGRAFKLSLGVNDRASSGFPISQWCPYGSTTRPKRQPYSIGNGRDFLGACGNRPGKRGIRIFDSQQHSHSAAAEGLRTIIQVLWRFVANPEFGSVHGQFGPLRRGSRFRCETIRLSRTRICKTRRLSNRSNRKEWGYSGFLRAGCLRIVAHLAGSFKKIISSR